MAGSSHFRPPIGGRGIQNSFTSMPSAQHSTQVLRRVGSRHTRKHRISAKPLPMEDVLEVGVEIANALDAAHAEGIIHREY
jgi:hypothetical protein